MTPAQQRILHRLVLDVSSAMIAEALAHRAFLRAPAAQLRTSYQLWMEVARQKTAAQEKLDRALRAIQSGDIEEQMSATLESLEAMP